MNGTQRREQIVKILKESNKPVSGRALAQMLGVSRQVIVQDMALLRAQELSIESTNIGYIISGSKLVNRVFKVKHTDEQVADELQSIIDLGGVVEDVFIYHKVYGTVRAELGIKDKADIDAFIGDLSKGKSGLLKNVTADYHYHTVCAPTEKLLDLIQAELAQKGYLAPLMEYEPVNFWE